MSGHNIGDTTTDNPAKASRVNASVAAFLAPFRNTMKL